MNSLKLIPENSYFQQIFTCAKVLAKCKAFKLIPSKHKEGEESTGKWHKIPIIAPSDFSTSSYMHSLMSLRGKFLLFWSLICIYRQKTITRKSIQRKKPSKWVQIYKSYLPIILQTDFNRTKLCYQVMFPKTQNFKVRTYKCPFIRSDFIHSTAIHSHTKQKNQYSIHQANTQKRPTFWERGKHLVIFELETIVFSLFYLQVAVANSAVHLVQVSITDTHGWKEHKCSIAQVISALFHIQLYHPRHVLLCYLFLGLN